MVSIEDIPAEVRWEIAAKAASATPLAYDMVFREALGDKYDEIERPIYVEAGKEMKSLATALGLPTDNARDLDDAQNVLTTILYGPEFEFGNVEGTGDRAVGKATGCAVLNRALEMGLDPKICLEACQTFCKSTIENLNPKYTTRSIRNMCAGDPYCEMVIELRG
ncbi:MAG: hypothetical protein C4B59_02570 [Candidatus Methanogaster sp.]|uniref:Uncharacterized protein n=1 Tax=Candidatus Methanogaster sp. TaxID=3386292 RepID=A0AC61L5V4_9EURY|nr:MAG: hypothetical protein C4B59_02570 [ANME-2 cluster archaeon]